MHTYYYHLRIEQSFSKLITMESTIGEANSFVIHWVSLQRPS